MMGPGCRSPRPGLARRHGPGPLGDNAGMTERQIHLRTCPLCEAMCGLEISVEDGQVALIRPDREDVWSKGFICPKGTTLGHLHHDPDRLRAPMVRDGETWREVTWDEAFARCG